MIIFARFGEVCKKHHKVVDKRIRVHASNSLLKLKKSVCNSWQIRSHQHFSFYMSKTPKVLIIKNPQLRLRTEHYLT